MEMETNEDKYACVYNEDQNLVLADVHDAVRKLDRNHDLRLMYQWVFTLSALALLVAGAKSVWIELWLLPLVLLFGVGYIVLTVAETYSANHACILYNRYMLIKSWRAKGVRK